MFPSRRVEPLHVAATRADTPPQRKLPHLPRTSIQSTIVDQHHLLTTSHIHQSLPHENPCAKYPSRGAPVTGLQTPRRPQQCPTWTWPSTAQPTPQVQQLLTRGTPRLRGHRHRHAALVRATRSTVPATPPPSRPTQPGGGRQHLYRRYHLLVGHPSKE